MSIKLLTPIEIKKLERLDCVEKVSEKQVCFTTKFKQRFYDEWMSGKKPTEIFTDAGVDPNVLGYMRIHGFTDKLRLQANREEGFQDTRAKNHRQQPKSRENCNDEERIGRLEQDVALLIQEIEFLKKIQSGASKKRNSV